MQTKADIFARLKNDILSLQGFRPAYADAQIDFGLGSIIHAFPNSVFAMAGVHEFICTSQEEATASAGFISGLLSRLQNNGNALIWISCSRLIFPPALQSVGTAADRIIFIDVQRQKEVLWAMEEGLKCQALAAVVGEISDLDFTASRRFQLAIEASGVGCFVLRRKPGNLTTASTSRWQIKPVQSQVENSMPGVGYPRLQVDLLKVRNGKPGSWVVEWVDGRFRYPSKMAVIRGQERQVKIG